MFSVSVAVKLVHVCCDLYCCTVIIAWVHKFFAYMAHTVDKRLMIEPCGCDHHRFVSFIYFIQSYAQLFCSIKVDISLLMIE